MAFNVSYIYEILDRYSGPLSKINRITQKFNQRIDRTKVKIGNAGLKVDKLGKKFGNLQNVFGAIAGTAGIYKVISSMTTLEDSLADVRRVADFNEKQFNKFKESTKNLSVEYGKNASALGEIAYQGKKFSIMEKDLIPFVKQISKAAVAFDTTESEAGRAFGSIKSKLGFTMKNVTLLTDSINFMADNTSAAGSNMINIIERLSGEFKQYELPPRLIAGWAAISDQVEVSQQKAASGFKMMIDRISKGGPKALKSLVDDPSKAIIHLLKSLQGLDKASRILQITKMFGTEAGPFVLKLAGNIKLIETTLKKAMDPKVIGSMDREFQNYLNRTSTFLKKVIVSLNNVFSTLGDSIRPEIIIISNLLIRLFVYLSNFVKKHPTLTKFAVILSIITIALTGMLVVISLLLPGLSILLGIIAGITFPMVATTAAIAGVVAAFIAWKKAGMPLPKTLKDIFGELKYLWMFIKEFLPSLETIKDSLKGFIEYIGSATQVIFKTIGKFLDFVILKPILKILQFMSKLIKMFKMLKGEGNFTDKFKDFGKFAKDKAKDLGKFAIETLSPNITPFARDNVLDRNMITKNSMSLEGGIKVSATPGTNIVEAKINSNLNRGANLAYTGL